MNVFTGEDFDAADHIFEIRKRVAPLVHILTRPLAKLTPCDHDWPDSEEGGGTDINGSCTKCGMSFMLYIHSECP